MDPGQALGKMADIQQWRRRVQPARSRTPGMEADDGENHAGPSAPRLREPKRSVSSYFYLGQGQQARVPPLSEESTAFPEMSAADRNPMPSAEREMDAVMCALMPNLCTPLDIRYNGMLMRIFEQFRNLMDEKAELTRLLEIEKEERQADALRFQKTEQSWSTERQLYKAECKRLEVLLANTSKRGVAEVTLARQNSMLHRRKVSADKKETFFEFLETTKMFEDRGFSSQRATLKPVIRSPSAKDRRISQVLTQKASLPNLHAEPSFGMPLGQGAFSLAGASLAGQANVSQSRPGTASSEQKDGVSEATFSSFSFEEHLFPEAGRAKHDEDPGADEDLTASQHFAQALARRHEVDPELVVPQPEQHLTTHLSESRQGRITSNALRYQRQRLLSSGSQEPSLVKRPSVMAKASSFFQRFRPHQLNIDTASANLPKLSRSFSFEIGDDAGPEGLSTADGATPNLSKDRTLRKSVSMCSLPGSTYSKRTLEYPLSPVPQSPTASTPTTEGRPASRIPTPVYGKGSLARPRREREDSTSSLLTAIRQGEELGSNGNSVSSSVYSAGSTSRDSLTKTAQASEPFPSLKGGVGHTLSEHTNALRGKGATSASSKSPGIPNVKQGTTSSSHRAQQHQRARTSTDGLSNRSDMSDARRENLRPLSDMYPGCAEGEEGGP